MEFLNLDESKIREFNQKIFSSPVAFADLVLGIHYHPGQVKWIKNSRKRINILRPGNRWGKTISAAGKHLWQCMCKPCLAGRIMSYEEWLRVEYQTLNFGPNYELGRGALQLAVEIAQGDLLIFACPFCDSHRVGKESIEASEYYCLDCLSRFTEPNSRLNKSILKDWAITENRADAQILPYIQFRTGARLLGRSYDEMGVAFKMKALAYVTGDECADIRELWTFTNNTLLPRVVSFNGQIDLVGTPQPDGTDYMRMIEMAEEDMGKEGWEKNGLFYTQQGSMYENTFLPKEAIEEIEKIADPMMREQIIRGQYVETGEKYFGFERVNNAIDRSSKLVEQPQPGGKYVTAVDFAGGESAWADFTVVMTIDYSKEPYRVVYFNRFKGSEMSIPAQYLLVEDVVARFGSRLIIDSSALGGKNAMAFLSHLGPISAEFGPTKSSTLKAEMLATLKIAFDGGNTARKRIRERDINGDWFDVNPDWGLIRFPEIPVLISELQNYKLDDTKLRTDCVMALAMLVHWLEMRRPKLPHNRAIDFDFLG